MRAISLHHAASLADAVGCQGKAALRDLGVVSSIGVAPGTRGGNGAIITCGQLAAHGSW